MHDDEALYELKAALNARFHDELRADLHLRAAEINACREILGAASRSSEQLRQDPLEAAWFDAGATRPATVRRRVLEWELALALDMYGLPHTVVSLEDHFTILHTVTDTPPSRGRAFELLNRIELGEAMRDHLRQIITFEHRKHPDLFPADAEELETNLLLAFFLGDEVQSRGRAVSSFHQLFRSKSLLEVLNQKIQRDVADCTHSVREQLLAGTIPDVDIMLHKGLDALLAERDFTSVLRPYVPTHQS